LFLFIDVEIRGTCWSWRPEVLVLW